MQWMHPQILPCQMSAISTSSWPTNRPNDETTEQAIRHSTTKITHTSYFALVCVCVYCAAQFRQAFETTIAAHNNHQLETQHQSIYITWNNRICTGIHSLCRIEIGWKFSHAFVRCQLNAPGKSKWPNGVSRCCMPIIEFDFIYCMRYYFVVLVRSNNELLFRYKATIKFIFVASKQRIK